MNADAASARPTHELGDFDGGAQFRRWLVLCTDNARWIETMAAVRWMREGTVRVGESGICDAAWLVNDAR